MDQNKRNDDIVKEVEAAKHDPLLADQLIASYKPYIASITSEVCKHHVSYGVHDELSFAMLGFYDAIMTYEKGKGTFLSYAALLMKRRVIDYLRSEQRHQHISLDKTDDEDQSLLDHLPSQKYSYKIPATKAIQMELLEFQQELKGFSLQLTDIAKYGPKQKRTLDACKRVVRAVVEKPSLIVQLKSSKRLPIQDILLLVDVERKVIERHRNYLIALLIIYSNGYECIREHLSGLSIPKTKGVIS
ncbi:hypothetical protein A4S06_06925 [Erysipelotrichaceae bacterium MTC7]|nr:hypothetical protein A4S06_06925 [Erysipelotrichaceae bacterium MTC7]